MDLSYALPRSIAIEHHRTGIETGDCVKIETEEERTHQRDAWTHEQQKKRGGGKITPLLCRKGEPVVTVQCTCQKAHYLLCCGESSPPLIILTKQSRCSDQLCA